MLTKRVQTAHNDDGATRFWSVERREESGDSWTQHAVLPSDVTSLAVQPGSYVVRAVNRASQQSSGAFVHVASTTILQRG